MKCCELQDGCRCDPSWIHECLCNKPHVWRDGPTYKQAPNVMHNTTGPVNKQPSVRRRRVVSTTSLRDIEAFVEHEVKTRSKL